MKWHQCTAIYVIGNRHPVATFKHEQQAEQWAEREFPGEWIKKTVKIPPLPVSPKAGRKNLKNVAAMLDNLDWDADGDQQQPDQVIRAEPVSRT